MKLKNKKMEIFDSTASYYSRFRRGYPDSVFEYLIKEFKLSNDHLLDLGCGTGQIAIPFAKRGMPMHAVDPNVEMLAEGLQCERDSVGGLGIAWYLGDDKRLNKLRLPPLKLCLMGSSFHWMDRDQVLRDLDKIIVGDGGVIVISGGESVWSGSGSGWPAIAKEVIVNFLGPKRKAGKGTYDHPKDRHEVVLARSSFSKVKKLEFKATEKRTVEDIIGLQLSTSYASPAQLGDKLEQYKNELSSRLFELEPSGNFAGTTTIEVLVATRNN